MKILSFPPAVQESDQVKAVCLLSLPVAPLPPEVVRVGGDDGELRSWRCICVYSIESRLIMRVIYD